MANLFPTAVSSATVAPVSNTSVKFGRSWQFDFESGEFVMSPTGKMRILNGVDAWQEWCLKALMTARYKWPIYSKGYGQEFDDSIGRNFTKAAAESEIQRMAKECLQVDPRTKDVGNFTFTWTGASTVFFDCEVTSKYNSSLKIKKIPVVLS
jgi:hypothetical protein